MKALLVRICSFSLVVLAACSSLAANYYVVPPGASQPQEPWSGWTTAHTNLLEVIALCRNGDTVYLTNQATYYITNQIEITYGVEVRSCAPDGSLDPETTILNGNYPLTTNRIFYLNHYDAWIKGLTLSNGCWYSTSQTSPWEGGGAVHILRGHLTNCYLLNNRNNHNYDGSVNGGGALQMGSHSGTVWNCVFMGNISTNNGGGALQVSYGTWEIHNCVFSQNETLAGGGGAIRAYHPTNLKLRDCQFLSNSSKKQGGGLMHSGGEIQCSGCLFYGNHTDLSAGGAQLGNGAAMQNCLIYGNTCQPGGSSIGGGVDIVSGPNVFLRNCTIAGNEASYGGGVAIRTNGYMENCIVWGNTSYHTQLPNYTFSSGVAMQFQMTNCCTTPDPLNYSSQCAAVGCITDDPQFEDAGAFKFNLLPNSPCIDAGYTREEMYSELDYAKLSRVDRFRRKVDIGAYEYYPAGILFKIK